MSKEEFNNGRSGKDEPIMMTDVDRLTGLPNREFLFTKLKFLFTQCKHSNERFAVFFIDLDRFKLVNDALGHLIGDQTLQEVAKRLSDNLSPDDIIARFGGDEFVVVARFLSSEQQAKEKAECLIKRIKEPLYINGYEFVVTASIGISSVLSTHDQAESLFKYSDLAMSRAKLSGGDRVEFYDRGIDEQFSKKFHLENDLRKAIEKGEFSLYYQPQLDVRRNELCGEEVLVRWFHPTLGVVSPNKFIKIAEETGLIISIGKWVLEEACKQKKKWIDQGYPSVPISINVSLRQFLQRDIVETIQSTLEKTKLAPYLLQIEVTETVTIDIHRTLGVLKRLKRLGVTISLDDFGTGYCSLQYVSQLPISELKIDQSFVQNIGKEMNSETIISMIINLAHSLKVKVIAEGVESQRELDYLATRKCDKIQGYFYSQPLDAVKYEQFMSGIMNGDEN